MQPVVMLPTYDEAENIRPMIEAVLAADSRIRVLVVDDDSPDGTARIAEEVAQGNDRVSVMLRRERRGRGYAGAEGFQRCLDMGGDPILEMDADFSHDPAHLPAFLKASEEFDVAIGSRHVAGGGESGRGAIRRLITWGAGVYLRTMLGVRGVQDPTSGYRCYRRWVLEAARLDTLRSQGPPILSEMLFRCRKLRITEIPIQFRDRELGHSKFNPKIMADSLLLALRVRLGAVFGRDPVIQPELGAGNKEMRGTSSDG